MFLWAPHLVLTMCTMMRKRSGRRPDVYSTSGVRNNQYGKEEVVISPWERDEGLGRKPLGRDRNLVLLLLFSRSVVSDFLDPMDCSTPGFQHARHCPPVSPGICSNLCPLNHWCYVTISSSAAPFSCPQSFPASESFPVSRLFASGGPSIGASVSASVLPVNIQGWI